MDGLLALYIFMLAAFTGYEIIAKVPVILHTPLMSGSNFIHGVVVVEGTVAEHTHRLDSRPGAVDNYVLHCRSSASRCIVL